MVFFALAHGRWHTVNYRSDYPMQDNCRELFIKLYVRHKVTWLPVCFLFSFHLYQIFFAYEESELFLRQHYGSNRGFQMHIIDNTQQKGMRVVREFKCCAGCHCCAHCGDKYACTVTVEAPPGRPIGYIRQRYWHRMCLKAGVLDFNQERHQFLNWLLKVEQ